MAELTIMKYYGSRSIQQHVINMINITAILKTLEIIMDNFFFVQFILNLLPQKYGLFQINYNSIEDKCDINELASKFTQEKMRLKAQWVIQ